MMLFSLLIGRLKLKVDPPAPLPPLPSILLSAHILQPWASIILLQINKPSPIPVPLLAFVANFENNLGIISESIPLPVSFILTIATSCLCLFSSTTVAVLVIILMVPFPVNLIALLSKFEMTCVNLVLSALTKIIYRINVVVLLV